MATTVSDFTELTGKQGRTILNKKIHKHSMRKGQTIMGTYSRGLKIL